MNKIILILIVIIVLFYFIKFKKETFSNIGNNNIGNNNIGNNNIKGIFYINLDKHKDRRIYMERQFNENNLNCKRIKGYDKKLLTKVKIEELKKNNIIRDDYYPDKSKLGSVGCLLAHINLYKHIKKNYNEGHFLIFEDDCQILPNFNNKLNKYYKTLPKNWDMAWLGYNKIKGDKVNNDWYRPKQGYFYGYNSQHHSYLINYNSIDKIINILLPIKKKFENKDMILRNNFDRFNAYFLKERLAIQDTDEFPISERTGYRNG